MPVSIAFVGSQKRPNEMLAAGKRGGRRSQFKFFHEPHQSLAPNRLHQAFATLKPGISCAPGNPTIQPGASRENPANRHTFGGRRLVTSFDFNIALRKSRQSFGGFGRARTEIGFVW